MAFVEFNLLNYNITLLKFLHHGLVSAGAIVVGDFTVAVFGVFCVYSCVL